jgi:iron(III) transport system substrate-binding protein
MSKIRKGFGGLVAGLLASALVAVPASGQTRQPVIVYAALGADSLDEFKTEFERDNPDIEIRWIDASSGILTARLLSERANPVADVVWGISVASIGVFDRLGMLEPYSPKGLENLKPSFRDPRTPPHWVGNYVYASAICFNTDEARKRRLPVPSRWQDLVDEAYAGQITMGNPNSTGTAFLMVAAWLQLFGEAGGWDFMEKLHKNIAAYTVSGSKPCSYAATGEFAVGLASEIRATQMKDKGAPIEPIYPSEGLGWDIDTSAIVKKAGDRRAAQRVVDWTISVRAGAIYARRSAIIALNFQYPKLPGIPDGIEERLISNDLSWVSHNRERILSEWRRRFESKSEKR